MGVRERCEIGVDAPVGVEYGEDLSRVAGVVFDCRDLVGLPADEVRPADAVARRSPAP